MNGISFLIYLIGIVGNFGLLFAWIGGLMVVITLIGSFFALIGTADARDSGVSFNAAWTWISRNSWKFIVGGIVCIMISIAIPSKQTMVLIAASEIAEDVIEIKEVAEVGGEAGMLIRESIGLLRGHIAEEIQNLDLKQVGTDAVEKVVETVNE